MFEVNIRYIGGLLSAFYLTGEEVSWPLEAPRLSRLEGASESTQSHPLISPMRNQGSKGNLPKATTSPHFLVPPIDSSSSV